MMSWVVGMAALALLGLAMIFCVVFAVVAFVLGDAAPALGALFLLAILVLFVKLAGKPGPRDPERQL